MPNLSQNLNGKGKQSACLDLGLGIGLRPRNLLSRSLQRIRPRRGWFPVWPPLPLAALAALSFFTPSPDSSAEKQGSLGLETEAAPLGGWPRWKRGRELLEPGNVLLSPSRRVPGIFLGSTDPATLHQTESPAPRDPIPADAVRSGIQWAEQTRVRTSRSQAPSASSRPEQESRLREVGTAWLCSACGRQPPSLGPPRTPPPAFSGAPTAPLHGAPTLPGPAGHTNAHAQAARQTRELPPGARVTVTAPVACGTALSAAVKTTDPPWQCLGLGQQPPFSRDPRQGPAISGVGQGGTRLRKAAAEFTDVQADPQGSPRCFRPAQTLWGVRVLETCPCRDFQYPELRLKMAL
uniref:uncharacterized protein LOC128929677 n=1 Tax=Callithrix jacchus TaxID=9483 RepID=UPI0023DD4371|nr:uncharacterized protein LOC128929677 [Callithrix jacchus]